MRKKENQEKESSNSQGGPDKLGLAEYAKVNLLSAGSGNVDDEGVSSVQDFNDSKENGHAVLHKVGHSLQTAGLVKLSTTAPAREEVLDLGSAARNSVVLKDLQSNENKPIQLKVQNSKKATSRQVEYVGSLSFVHAVGTFGNDSFDYDHEHDNASASSYEFHKGNGVFNKLVLGPLSQPAPSKWDDAEKGLESYVTETVVVDGRPFNQDEGETKKIDPNKPIWKLDDRGPSKFAFMPTVAHPMTRPPNGSSDCYSLEDVFCCDPGDPKEVKDNEVVLKRSLRIESQLQIQLLISANIISLFPSIMLQLVMFLLDHPRREDASAPSPMDTTDNKLECQAEVNTTELSEKESHMKTRWEIMALAWEEAEKAKHMTRYKLEEVKIGAWENHQKAKAEVDIRRIEVKLECMRGYAHGKSKKQIAKADGVPLLLDFLKKAILIMKTSAVAILADFTTKHGAAFLHLIKIALVEDHKIVTQH
eukprot:Gb_28839 [translate_table: standard]